MFPHWNDVDNCCSSVISFIVNFNYIFLKRIVAFSVFSFLEILRGRSGCWVHFWNHTSIHMASQALHHVFYFLYNPHAFASIFSHQVFLFLRGLTNLAEQKKTHFPSQKLFILLSFSVFSNIVATLLSQVTKNL